MCVCVWGGGEGNELIRLNISTHTYILGSINTQSNTHTHVHVELGARHNRWLVGDTPCMQY